MHDRHDLRKLFRAYKRSASRLRDVREEPAEDLALKFSLIASRDQPAKSSFAAGPSVDRHAALLRPFMATGSHLELPSVWATLLSTGAVTQERRAQVEDAFAKADSPSPGFRSWSVNVYLCHARGVRAG